jgi:lysophospholipid acyltransferase (LPLAT)-like uncharacterized protein
MKRKIKLWLAKWLAYTFVRILHATLRYEVIGAENRKKAEQASPKSNFAIATWHQNAILGISGHAGQGVSIIISPSFDGELVTFLANKLGLGAIRGSSSRGGKEALSAAHDLVHSGGSVAITVDGPRGPRHEVKAGIVALSLKTRISILPMNAIADRYWVLNKTWDKFRIPKPFSRVRVYYGDPIFPPAGEDPKEFEDIKKEVSGALHAIESEASRYRRY